MIVENLRKPLIGIVGCENRQNACVGDLTGRIVGRRGAILVFTFTPKYADSIVPLEAAQGARMAGGETLGISTNNAWDSEIRKRYATWVLTPSAGYETYEYQTLISMCDALISIGLDLPQQSYFIRRAGRIPLIEIANTRPWSDQRPSLMQVAESPRAAVNTAISEIMARRKGA